MYPKLYRLDLQRQQQYPLPQVKNTHRKQAVCWLTVLALIVSSPVLGAGAVQDTYELVRSAICKVVDAAGEASLSKKLLRSLRDSWVKARSTTRRPGLLRTR